MSGDRVAGDDQWRRSFDERRTWRRVAPTIPEGCLGAVAQEALSPWPLNFELLTSCGMATQTTRNELSESPACQSQGCIDRDQHLLCLRYPDNLKEIVWATLRSFVHGIVAVILGGPIFFWRPRCQQPAQSCSDLPRSRSRETPEPYSAVIWPIGS
jgi:hypothetical protein